MAAVVRQLLQPDEAAETNTELCRKGEFLMTVTFCTLGAVVQARGGGGTGADPHRLLDISFVAIVLSLASSVLHLRLHCNLRLPWAHLFLPLGAFFTAAAVFLLITTVISSSLRWVPFAGFFSTLLLVGCFELFPAVLHYVAILRRWRFVVFLIGPAADDVDMQSSSNQLSPSSMDHEQRVHLHAPEDQLELGMMGSSEAALHTPHST